MGDLALTCESSHFSSVPPLAFLLPVRSTMQVCIVGIYEIEERTTLHQKEKNTSVLEEQCRREN